MLDGKLVVRGAVIGDDGSGGYKSGYIESDGQIVDIATVGVDWGEGAGEGWSGVVVYSDCLSNGVLTFRHRSVTV